MKRFLIIPFILLFALCVYARQIVPIWEDIPSLSTPTYITSNDNSVAVNWSTTITILITPTVGTNRCFSTAAFWNDDSITVSSVTYDGNAMTLIKAHAYVAANRAAAAYYYCTDVGTSGINIVWTLSGNTSSIGYAGQADGCNTSSLIDATESADVANANPQQFSDSITTSTNNTLLMSFAGSSHDAVTFSVCNTTGQTEALSDDEAGSNSIVAGYYDHSTAGAKTQCWEGNDADEDGIIILWALKPGGS